MRRNRFVTIKVGRYDSKKIGEPSNTIVIASINTQNASTSSTINKFLQNVFVNLNSIQSPVRIKTNQRNPKHLFKQMTNIYTKIHTYIFPDMT